MQRSVVQGAHREQGGEEDDFREHHGPVRSADRGAGRTDVGEREGETGHRNARDRCQRHGREGTEPRNARIARVKRDERGARQAADPDTDGHLMKRADEQQ